jgi:hypothetical protein
MRVWDSLTFESLRLFGPVARLRADGDEQGISEIILGPEKHVVYAAIGSRVMAWMAGPVGKNDRGPRGRNIRGKKVRGERGGGVKYHREYTLRFISVRIHFKNRRRTNGAPRSHF